MQTVALVHPPHYGRTRFDAGPSRFTLFPGESIAPTPPPSSPSAPSGPMEPHWEPVVGPLVLVEPFDACSPVYADGFYVPVEELHSDFTESDVDAGSSESDEGQQRGLLRGAIAVMKRGGCMFLEKAQNVKQVGIICIQRSMTHCLGMG